MALQRNYHRTVHYISSDSEEDRNSGPSHSATRPQSYSKPTRLSIKGRRSTRLTTRTDMPRQGQTSPKLPPPPSVAATTTIAWSPQRPNALKNHRDLQSPIPDSNHHHHHHYHHYYPGGALPQPRRTLHTNTLCPRRALLVPWARRGGARLRTAVTLVLVARQLGPSEVWVEQEGTAEPRFDLAYSWDINGLLAAFVLRLVVTYLRHVLSLR